MRWRGDVLEVEALATGDDGGGDLVGSVVAKMNLTCSGGSSSVLSSALKAAAGEHVDFVDDVDFVAGAGRGGGLRVVASSRIWSTRVVGGAVDFDDVDVFAAGDGLAGVAGAAGVAVGAALGQLRALARMRAVEVLPTPRVPVKR